MTTQSTIVLITACIMLLASLGAQAPIIQHDGYLELSHPEDESAIYIGKQAGQVKTHSILRSNNTYIGYLAGMADSSGFSNVYLGAEAGRRSIGGFYNTFVGSSAGELNTYGSSNSFYGHLAGNSNTIGNLNSFYGNSAGKDNQDGGSNSFFGFAAGSKNTIGYSNTSLGTLAGHNNITGFENVYIGHQNGYNNTSGSENVYIGHRAGYAVTGGTNSIIIGPNAGPTDSTTVSEALFIDIESSNTPLIHGDFKSDAITINGALEVRDGVTALINSPSDRAIKEDIRPVDDTDILHTLSQIDIYKWKYKASSNSHLGPMAQDFYAAFGLGGSETTIATVDADGVALAAIKALAAENESLNNSIKSIQLELAQIKNQINAK